MSACLCLYAAFSGQSGAGQLGLGHMGAGQLQVLPPPPPPPPPAGTIGRSGREMVSGRMTMGLKNQKPCVLPTKTARAARAAEDSFMVQKNRVGERVKRSGEGFLWAAEATIFLCG